MFKVIGLQQINCWIFVLYFFDGNCIKLAVAEASIVFHLGSNCPNAHSWFVWLHSTNPAVLNHRAYSHPKMPFTCCIHEYAVQSEPYVLSCSHLSGNELFASFNCSLVLYHNFSAPPCCCNSLNVMYLCSSGFTCYLQSLWIFPSFTSSMFIFDSIYVCVPKIGVCVCISLDR